MYGGGNPPPGGLMPTQPNLYHRSNGGVGMNMPGRVSQTGALGPMHPLSASMQAPQQQRMAQQTHMNMPTSGGFGQGGNMLLSHNYTESQHQQLPSASHDFGVSDTGTPSASKASPEFKKTRVCTEGRTEVPFSVRRTNFRKTNEHHIIIPDKSCLLAGGPKRGHKDGAFVCIYGKTGAFLSVTDSGAAGIEHINWAKRKLRSQKQEVQMMLRVVNMCGRIDLVDGTRVNLEDLHDLICIEFPEWQMVYDPELCPVLALCRLPDGLEHPELRRAKESITRIEAELDADLRDDYTEAIGRSRKKQRRNDEEGEAAVESQSWENEVVVRRRRRGQRPRDEDDLREAEHSNSTESGMRLSSELPSITGGDTEAIEGQSIKKVPPKIKEEREDIKEDDEEDEDGLEPSVGSKEDSDVELEEEDSQERGRGRVSSKSSPLWRQSTKDEGREGEDEDEDEEGGEEEEEEEAECLKGRNSKLHDEEEEEDDEVVHPAWKLSAELQQIVSACKSNDALAIAAIQKRRGDRRPNAGESNGEWLRCNLLVTAKHVVVHKATTEDMLHEAWQRFSALLNAFVDRTSQQHQTPTPFPLPAPSRPQISPSSTNTSVAHFTAATGPTNTEMNIGPRMSSMHPFPNFYQTRPTAMGFTPPGGGGAGGLTSFGGAAGSAPPFGLMVGRGPLPPPAGPGSVRPGGMGR